MNRRQAIKQMGFGITAGVALPGFLASCGKDGPGPEVKFDGTVAIIGAGAAGLFAADILRSKGVKVKIFEAASQVGGRIRSLRNQKDLAQLSVADFPVELGAELIFGSDSRWATEIKNLKVPVIDLSTTATDRFILDHSAMTAAERASDVEFSGAQNFVDGLPSFSGSGSVGQAVAGFADRVKPLLNSQIGNFYGTSNGSLGAGGLAESLSLQEHDGNILTIRTNPMQDFLISRFSKVNEFVQLNTAITSVNHSGDVVELTDKDGVVYQAEKVIVTVPVTMIKSGKMSFSPALPASFTSSLERIGMDPCIRLLIDFKKNFWGEDAGFLWGLENAPYCLSTGAGRSEFFQTLSMTVCGSKATELSPLGADMITTILNELDQVYAGQATQFVRRDLEANQVIGIAFDWTKEEFIGGGFSYPKPGATIEDRMNIGQPINGKLFFAGEATDVSGDAGTINGALASAERATDEVVAAILGTA